jgi:hypothetical protein
MLERKAKQYIYVCGKQKWRKGLKSGGDRKGRAYQRSRLQSRETVALQPADEKRKIRIAPTQGTNATRSKRVFTSKTKTNRKQRCTQAVPGKKAKATPPKPEKEQAITNERIEIEAETREKNKQTNKQTKQRRSKRWGCFTSRRAPPPTLWSITER